MADDAGARSTLRFTVRGMDCAACASKIEAAVSRVPGVASASVSFARELLTVDGERGRTQPAAVADAVKRLGYRIEMSDHAGDGPKGRPHDHGDHGGDQWWRSGKVMFTAGAVILLGVAYGLSLILPTYAGWVFIGATAIAALPIARRAVAAAFSGSPFSIETLMVIAAVGAVIIGAAEEAAVVVVLFLIGELLEGYAANRARSSIRALAGIVPRTALVLDEGGQTRDVPIEALAVGQSIRVRPGDRIAADGTIVAGASSVDEAPVTGESIPKQKGMGDAVYAGSINGEGVLSVRVERASADNTIARIIKLVESAQDAKAPTERFIDKFSAFYTPAIVVIALLIAIVPPLAFAADWSTWIYRALATLLIACPCALVISVPAAIAAGLSAGARQGLLLKGGAVLEAAGKINTVAFDKTGTLTEGKPKVTDVIGLGMDADKVLAGAAALEAGSSHPIAIAILNHAKQKSVAVPQAEDARAIAGQGVEGSVGGTPMFLGAPRFAAARVDKGAEDHWPINRLEMEGKTVAALVSGGKIAGLIAVRDELRFDAIEGVRELEAMGINGIILTGDNELTATAIAEEVGLDVKAQLLPEDKLRIIGDLRREGKTVAQVGDGINDAPALAAADIGIAMGSGTDVALETADAAILNSRVRDVARLIRLSRQTMAIIRQNIGLALGLKAIFMITSVAGLTGLWLAILADTGATVLVTINALRLLRALPSPKASGPS